MLVYIETLAVILVLSSYPIIHSVEGANIICSKSEYVTSGIEFKKCQDETLHSFEPSSRGARGKKRKQSTLELFYNSHDIFSQQLIRRHSFRFSIIQPLSSFKAYCI